MLSATSWCSGLCFRGVVCAYTSVENAHRANVKNRTTGSFILSIKNQVNIISAVQKSGWQLKLSY
jgi:hypothetical protein